MKKILFLIILIPCSAVAQTRNIVPRATGEGNIGLSTITWLGVYANNFYGSGSNLTGVATNLSGVRYSTDAVSTALINLSTVTTQLNLKLTSATIPSNFIDLSTITTALADKVDLTETSSVTFQHNAFSVGGSTLSVANGIVNVSSIIASGDIYAKMGTAISPAYSFTGTNQTGMYWDGATISFTHGGNRTFYIGAAGIYTTDLSMGGWWAANGTSGTAGLGFGYGHRILWANTNTNASVAGDVGIERAAPGVLKISNGSTGTGSLMVSTLTVVDSAFSVGGSTLVVKEGNVGISTNTPRYMLDVYGGGRFTSSMTVAGGYYGDGSNLTGISAGYTTYYFQLGGWPNDIYKSTATPVDMINVASTWTITGLQAFSVYGSTTGSVIFEVKTGTGTNTIGGVTWTSVSTIELATATVKSAWTAVSTAVSMDTKFIGLFVNQIPATGALPLGTGVTLKYWRKDD